jgi:phasin family protein
MQAAGIRLPVDTSGGTMTTIRQLIQTGPVKANELFAKLGDTSDTAVKTRERLFTELKEELELLARLEEEHIFPVLRKNKKTKGLVPDALNDNKLTRKLLAQLEKMPKDSEEFTDGLAELRRTFQQHVRDEKKELLPAVLKALSDEEAQAIVEGIEDTKAEVEEARRAEAEQRRAAAREEREQAENVRQTAESVAETMATTVAFPVHLARRTAETARENVKSSLNAAAQGFQSLTEQFTNFTGLAEAEELARRSFENLQAVSDSSTALARGFQEASQLWFALAQERLTKNVEGISRLSRCRSPQDFIAMQSELAREAMQQAVETSRRIGQVSMRVADEAAGVIQARASAKPDRVRQVA